MSNPEISVIGGDPVQRDLVESLVRRYVRKHPDTIAVEISWRRGHWHVDRAIANIGGANEDVRNSVVSLLRGENFPSEETR